MSDEIKEKLESELEKARWMDLKEQLKREALIFVSPELDIIEVGVAMAVDSKDPVKNWLDSKLMRVMKKEEESSFNDDSLHHMLIIDPFVIFQPLFN